MQEAAKELDRGGATPFAGFVSDPCDGRTQGTLGMMESLAYRNDAAIVFRRLIRSLPTRRGVMGVATCDKGLPGDDARARGAGRSAGDHRARRRDAAADGRRARRRGADGRRALHARQADAARGGRAGLRGLRDARRRLPVPRHGGDQPGRRRGARARALPLGARALRASPCGSSWRGARRAPCRTWPSRAWARRTSSPTTPLHNAMVVHAAFGGSTNLLLHMPAIAYAAGLRRPDRRGLGARQPRRAAHRQRAAERPGRPPDRARLPGRRRARGDAAAARPRAAAARRA